MTLTEAFNRNHEKMVKRKPVRLEEILTWSTSSLISMWQWKQNPSGGVDGCTL